MKTIRQKLLYIWAHYGLHFTAFKAVELFVAFIMLSGVTATIIINSPIHHKTVAPIIKPKIVSITQTTKPVVVKPVTTPAATPTPAPTPTPVTKVVTVTPKVVQTAPAPIPATQPTPGSPVKQLVATAPTSTATSTSGSSTSSTNSGTTSSSTPLTTTVVAPSLATGGYYSSNWSGYVGLSGDFTNISGSWTIPKVSGNSTQTSGDAAWIGIGGATTNDLIQVGTEDTVSPSGTVSTLAFYELLPSAALEIRSLNINSGDSMTANITEISTGQWKISITDNTTSQNYTTTVNYSSSYSSSEWIEEDPEYTTGALVPFNSFDHAIFSSASATNNGILGNLNNINAEPITLLDSSYKPLVSPSILTGNNDGFWVLHD